MSDYISKQPWMKGVLYFTHFHFTMLKSKKLKKLGYQIGPLRINSKACILSYEAQSYAKDITNKLVVLIGGKAFCAGGDIRAVIESVKRGGYHHEEFFREEYRLNALIGTLSIPYIALIDGITMGKMHRYYLLFF